MTQCLNRTTIIMCSTLRIMHLTDIVLLRQYYTLLMLQAIINVGFYRVIRFFMDLQGYLWEIHTPMRLIKLQYVLQV